MSDRESELFHPIKEYLEELGFKVDAEVKGCDVVASLDSEIIIVELKNRFSLKLLYQAVERQEISKTVYVAIGNRTAKQYPPDIEKIKKLLSRLNIGLLIVHFRIVGTFVEPVLELQQTEIIPDKKKKAGLLKELDGRYYNFNIGGSPSSKKQITTYMLNAIQIAVTLNVLGQSSPSMLIKNGTSSNTQSILSQNFYGWFERITRGIYKLNSDGNSALLTYSVQSAYFKKKLQSMQNNL